MISSTDPYKSYYLLISEHLDKLPVEKKEDFVIVAKALEALRATSQSSTQSATFLVTDESLKTRVKYLGKLNDQLSSIKYLLDNPDAYVQNPQHYEKFRGEILEGIARKINEFTNKSENEKEGARHISDQQSEKAAGEKYQQQIKARQAPKERTVAHVLSTDDQAHWSDYKYSCKYDRKWPDYWTKDAIEAGNDLREILKSELYAQAKIGADQLTATLIKQHLPSLQSFFEKEVLPDTLKGLVSVEQFYSLEEEQLTAFGSEELTTRLAKLLHLQDIDFDYLATIQVCNFRLILDFIDVVIAYSSPDIQLKALIELPFTHLFRFLTRPNETKRLFEEGITWANLVLLKWDNLEYIINRPHYIATLKGIFDAGVVPATFSKLDENVFKNTLENPDQNLPLLLGMQEALTVQKSKEDAKIQQYIDDKGLKDFITVQEFQALEAKVLVQLLDEKQLLPILKLCKEQHIKIDLAKFFKLGSRVKDELKDWGYRLLKLGMPFDAFAEFNWLISTDFKTYIGFIKQLVQEEGLTFDQFVQLTDFQLRINDYHLGTKIKNLIKIRKYDLDFEVLLELVKTFKLENIDPQKPLWRGIVLRKSKNEDSIRAFLHALNVEEKIPISRFRALSIQAMETLTNPKKLEERRSFCERYKFDLVEVLPIPDVTFDILNNQADPLLRLGMTINDYDHLKSEPKIFRLLLESTALIQKVLDWGFDFHCLARLDPYLLKKLFTFLKTPKYKQEAALHVKKEPRYKVGFWKGILSQQLNDQKIDIYLKGIGVRGLITPEEFRSLNVGFIALLMEPELKASLLQLCRRRQFDFRQIMRLQMDQLWDLMHQGQKLMDLGMTFDEYQQSTKGQRSILIKHLDVLEDFIKEVNFTAIVRLDNNRLRYALEGFEKLS